MKIAIYIHHESFTHRGIFRAIKSLLSKVSSLYPEVELYLATHKGKKYNLEKYFSKDYKFISDDPGTLIKCGIDFLVFYTNGNGLENDIYNVPYFQTVSILHDVLGFMMHEDKIYDNVYQLPINLQYMRDIYQKRINNSDVIFTISEFSKEEILKNLIVPLDKKVNIIYNAPILKLETRNFIYNNAFSSYFLYNGTYSERKGVLQLLYNFIDLKIHNKLKSQLVLTGKNDLSADKNISGLIQFGIKNGYIIDKGFVSDKYLAYLYKNALAMVYPSSYEGFGIPLVEAMSLGCPIITCFNSSIKEICINDTAYFIDKYDYKSFQEALILFESPNFVDKRQKLIENGYKRGKDFSWEKSAHKFIEILKKEKDNCYINKIFMLKNKIREIKQAVTRFNNYKDIINEKLDQT